jgi:hypothetical protein
VPEAILSSNLRWTFQALPPISQQICNGSLFPKRSDAKIDLSHFARFLESSTNANPCNLPMRPRPIGAGRNGWKVWKMSEMQTTPEGSGWQR